MGLVQESVGEGSGNRETAAGGELIESHELVTPVDDL